MPTDDTTYFENCVSKKVKEGLLRALGPEAFQRQQEMHLKLVEAGRAQRIADAKAACAARRKKREAALATKLSPVPQ